MQKYLNINHFLLLIGIFIFFSLPHTIFAACTSVPISGNYTVSTSCAFAGTVDGVDAGTGTSNTANITINPGQTLTLNAGQTIAWGGTITINGSLAINATASLKQGPIWMTDQDADGYPLTTTQTWSQTQGANSRRRNVMVTVTNIDLNDTNASINKTTTPSFSPTAGSLLSGTTVTISSSGADAIYYTTDGSTPTTSSTNQATTPLVINSAVTVKALAVKAGYDNSAIATAAYTVITLSWSGTTSGSVNIGSV
ncbi:chitobiase/beta-hexosaminidase C-terminal domain-containing protein, partial [Patescibacteria group bacterium]|nr:chitobiase/beta-hexosaminidase C-terminal domain-containing protein [Patescibacteria group bacterium]